MSGTDADNGSYDDMILEEEMTSYDDMTSHLTDQSTDAARVSLLDWTECLIEVIVSTEESPSADDNDNPFPAANNHETIEVNLDEHSAEKLTLSPPSGRNDTQTINQCEEMHLEDCLTLIKEDSNSNSLNNSPPSTRYSSPIVCSQDSHVSTECSIISAWTNEGAPHFNSSSIIPSCDGPHLNTALIPEHGHRHSTPSPEKQHFTSKSSDKRPCKKRQLTLDGASVKSSHQFTSQFSGSFFNVDVIMDTADNDTPLVLNTSSNSALNHSLNTPIFEEYPPLRDTNGSRVVPSCPIGAGYHFQSLNLPNDSNTLGSITPPNEMPKCILDYTLNTPVLVTQSPLKNTSGSSDVSICFTSVNDQPLSLDSPSDSRTISIGSPEKDIDFEDLVPYEEDIPSTHPSSSDNPTSQLYSPIHLSETAPIFYESDIPFSLTENTLEGITVHVSSASENRSSNPSFQRLHLQPSSDTTLLQTDTPLPQTDTPSLQILSPDMTISYEMAEMPLDFWTNNSKRHTLQDISEQKSSQACSSDFVFSSHVGSGQETRSSNIATSNHHMAEDLIDNLSDLHNYCIHVISERRLQHNHEPRKVTASNPVVILNAEPKHHNPEVAIDSCFSNKQSSGEGNSILDTFTDTVPFDEKNDTLPGKTISKYIIHPKHKIKKLNRNSVKNNKTLIRHNNTWIKPRGKIEQYIVPCRKNIEQTNNQKYKSTDTLQLTAPALPIILNDSRLNSSTLVLEPGPYDMSPDERPYDMSPDERPYDMSPDAILSLGYVFTQVVTSDNVMSREEHQRSTAQARASSDISDISLGCFHVSSSFPAVPASLTEGVGSREPLTGNKLKDTIRSRLKAKRNINASSQTNLELQERGQSSRSNICAPSPPSTGCSSRSYLCASSSPSTSCSSTSSATFQSRDGKCSPWLVTLSRRGSDSCASSMSQDGVSDSSKRINVKDEEDSASVQSPQTAGFREKGADKYKGNEGKRLAQRERNRVAAQRCRKKKIDTIDTLTQHIRRLEQKQELIKSEVVRLESEREELQEMWRLHSLFCTRDNQRRKR